MEADFHLENKAPTSYTTNGNEINLQCSLATTCTNTGSSCNRASNNIAFWSNHLTI